MSSLPNKQQQYLGLSYIDELYVKLMSKLVFCAQLFILMDISMSQHQKASISLYKYLPTILMQKQD